MIRLILLRLLIDRDVKIAFHCPSDVLLSASDHTVFLYSRLTSRYHLFFIIDLHFPQQTRNVRKLISVTLDLNTVRETLEVDGPFHPILHLEVHHRY